MCIQFNYFGYKLFKVYRFFLKNFICILLVFILFEVFIEFSVNDWVQDIVGVCYGVGCEFKMIILVVQLKVKYMLNFIKGYIDLLIYIVKENDI